MKPYHGRKGELRPTRAWKIIPFLKIILLVSLLCPQIVVSAQDKQEALELKIGDKVPTQVWQFPLQIVNRTGETRTITLNEHKGKLIILDFWSTYCTTCIVNMPYFHKLQAQFPGQLQVLPVTSEDPEKIAAFLQSNPVMGKLNISSIVSDKFLRAVFPNETLPHIVVVDGKGVVRAITMREYLDEKVISQLIDGAANVYIPQKREGLPKPLLAISSQYDDVNTARPLYYSAITGFMDGLAHSMSWKPDTVNGVAINRYYVSNIFLMKLYTLALPGALALSTQRRILEVKDPSRYVYASKNNSQIDWRRKNYYSYESVLPGNVSKDDAERKMKADLDLFFQLYGRNEKRVVPCLALIDIKKDNDPYKTSGGEELYVSGGVIPHRFFDKVKKVGPAASGATTYIRNMEFSGLHWIFSRLLDTEVPVIINKTGFTGNFDLDLPDGPSTLAALKLALRKQGLDLVPAKQEMEMFVLTEKGYSPDSNELQFSEYGYVPKNSGKTSSR